MFCVALCMAVAFISPHIARTYIDEYDDSEWEFLNEFLSHPPDGLVDDTLCLTCHDAGSPGDDPPTLHGIHGSGQAGCMDCHTGSTALGTVFSVSCVVCHPLGDNGACQLIDLHDPGFGGDCLGCHTECVDETTTTTSVDETTTTTSMDETTTTTSMDETTTTTSMDETSTTTTTDVITTTTTSVSGDASISVTPSSAFRSRWIWLPSFQFINGTNTNFAMFSSNPTYTPANAVIELPALVLGPEVIWTAILVNPAWFAMLPDDSPQTVTVTVDGLSDTITIEFLPFIFDEP
jgi:hypothetical protein